MRDCWVHKGYLAMGETQSPIRELFDHGLEQKRLYGEEAVVDLTLGNPAAKPPQKVLETMKRLLEDVDPVRLHGYTTAAGRIETRAAIARSLTQRFGLPIHADEIFMSCGAAAAISLALKALCPDATSRVMALAPFFTEYRSFATGAAAVLDCVPALDDFSLNLQGIQEALQPETRVLLLNSPNNPGGQIYEEADVRALAALLNKHEAKTGRPVHLIADEPYRELVYDAKKPAFLPTLYRNSLVAYSYSKSFSLAGDRIGYLLVPDQVAGAQKIRAAVIGAARASGYVCAPSFFQYVVEACVDVQPDLGLYRKNRERLYQALLAMGYDCVEPAGAFYLFVKAPSGDAEAFSQRAKEENLLIVPGTNFGCAAHCRVAYCVPYERIERSLPLFQKIYDSYLNVEK